MAMDFVDLSTCPVAELGVQVSQDTDYLPAMRQECKVYMRQLVRVFGEPPAGAYFKIQSNPHDFGSYLEVVVRFSDTNEEAAEWAYKCQDEMPEHWDEQAKKELELLKQGFSWEQIDTSTD